MVECGSGAGQRFWTFLWLPSNFVLDFVFLSLHLGLHCGKQATLLAVVNRLLIVSLVAEQGSPAHGFQ